MSKKQELKLHRYICTKDFEMEKDYDDQDPDIAFTKGKEYIFLEKGKKFITISDGLSSCKHILYKKDMEEFFVKAITVNV